MLSVNGIDFQSCRRVVLETPRQLRIQGSGKLVGLGVGPLVVHWNLYNTTVISLHPQIVSIKPHREHNPPSPESLTKPHSHNSIQPPQITQIQILPSIIDNIPQNRSPPHPSLHIQFRLLPRHLHPPLILLSLRRSHFLFLDLG